MPLKRYSELYHITNLEWVWGTTGQCQVLVFQWFLLISYVLYCSKIQRTCVPVPYSDS
jgi:hypothetical protein